MNDRPDRDTDLEAAYARAHGLADEGLGPSAAVRANVLAAAREMAGRARVAPVAPPVAAVARGRSMAVNLSSWRVRSGAAVCAALLVALGAWRFDASHRTDGAVQVATASLELAAPPTRPLARDLPAPPFAGASTPYVAPPPVVDDPVARTPSANVASARLVPHDMDVIVAQADSADRAPRTDAPPEAHAEARRPAAAAPAVRLAEAAAPAPAPVAVAPEAPFAPAPAQRPESATSVAASPPQLATLPPLPPSVVPRRVAVVPGGRSASLRDAKVAATELQHGPVAGASLRRVEAADAGATALHAAADRGDVDTLKALLAAPAAHVDAPDANGRTALLHAVLAQHLAAARLLVAAGADPARADQAGLTPRTAAQGGANAEIAALLAPPP